MTEQPSPAMGAASQSARPRRVRRWLVASLLGLVIVGSVWRLLSFNLWDSDEFKQPPTWDGTPRFAETAFTKHKAPPDSSFLQRFLYAYDDLSRRHSGKNLRFYNFPASPNALHSVPGLLTQCREITGTRYLVAQEAYLIEFGHTNTLVGTQWVATVESVLQTDQPQCIHPASNHIWHENLLLIREKPDVVKVVPRSRLADYQRAGLVDRNYKLEPVAKPTGPAP